MSVLTYRYSLEQQRPRRCAEKHGLGTSEHGADVRVEQTERGGHLVLGRLQKGLRRVRVLWMGVRYTFRNINGKVIFIIIDTNSQGINAKKAKKCRNKIII